MSNNFQVSSVNNQVNQGSYLKSTNPENPSEEIVKNFEDTMTVSSDSIKLETGPMGQAESVKFGKYTAGSNNSESITYPAGKTETDEWLKSFSCDSGSFQLRNQDDFIRFQEEFKKSEQISEDASNGKRVDVTKQGSNNTIPGSFTQVNEPYVGLSSAPRVKGSLKENHDSHENVSCVVNNKVFIA